MLGDSIECKCSTPTKCSVSVQDGQCECDGFCDRHIYLYNDIKRDLTKCCFMTLTPPPIKEILYEFGAPCDVSRFMGFCKHLRTASSVELAIIVAELTEKAQLHYHAFIRFTNKVSFIKQVVQPLFYSGNIKALYKPPRRGIHYLFKAHNMMQEYLGNCPVKLKIRDIDDIDDDSDTDSDSDCAVIPLFQNPSSTRVGVPRRPTVALAEDGP